MLLSRGFACVTCDRYDASARMMNGVSELGRSLADAAEHGTGVLGSYRRRPKNGPLAASAAATQLDALVEKACSELEQLVATSLFSAADPIALRAAIDRLIEEQSFFDLNRQLAGLVTMEMVREQATMQGVPERMRDAAGMRNAAVLGTIARLEQAVALAALQFNGWLAQHAEVLAQANAAGARAVPGPLGFMRDRTVPPAVKRALLARERGEACAIALAAAADRAPASWVIDELVADWVCAQREYLRLAGSLPGVSLPPDIFAPSERLDLARIEARTRAANGAYEESLAAARAAGEEVFPRPDRCGDD
jgi:PPE-repeat protein